MMKLKKKHRPRILLSAQSALLGEIFPALQEIDVSWSDHTITLLFFVDQNHTEEDIESINCIESEMIAHFSDSEKIEIVSNVIVDDLCPENRGEVCVFARRPIN